MTDGSGAADPGTPDQRPPGWQAPSEPARTWTPAPPPPAPYGQPYGQPHGQQHAQPYGQAPAPQYSPTAYQPLHQARPVYKPGTIPLRPLGMGDMFSGAVETIRRNPRATLGIAAVVLTAFMLVPVLATLAWGAVQGFGSSLTDSGGAGLAPQDAGLLITAGAGSVLSWLATVVLTGMIVHVVEHAARGQKLGAAQAWQLTKPRVWRLLGLSLSTFLILLVGVWLPIAAIVVVAFLASTAAGVALGVVGVLGALAVTAFLWARLFLLAAPSVVLEQRNVFASMRRSWELTRGQFWRVFGIGLLTTIVAAAGGQFLTFPFAIVGAVAGAIWPDTLIGVLVGLLANNVAQVVAGALTTPFSAGVAALQYLDQRIRKEGYDIALIAQVPVPAQYPPAQYPPMPYPPTPYPPGR